MRKLTISILVVILLVPVFYLNLVYVYYELEKEAITQNYCVNLPLEEVPTCFGKCYITDLAEQNTRHQDSSNLPVVEDKTVNFHIVELDQARISCSEELSHALFIPPELNPHTHLFAHSIFHPPRA